MGEGERAGSKRELEAGGGKRRGEEELGRGEQLRARAHCQPGSHPPPTTSSPRASKLPPTASACGTALERARKA